MNDTRIFRGDVVVCALTGDYGKPRPALVVQSDLFNETHASIVVCPISSEITHLTLFRVAIANSETSGLRKHSEVMVDKIAAIKRTRISRKIGQLPKTQMRLVNSALTRWLDIPGEHAV